MPFSHLQEPKCKFCSGLLRFDFERKVRAPGFVYYRCEECGMSNVFSIQMQRPAFPVLGGAR